MLAVVVVHMLLLLLLIMMMMILLIPPGHCESVANTSTTSHLTMLGQTADAAHDGARSVDVIAITLGLSPVIT